MLSQTNMTQAEKFLRKAVRLGLAMDHDLAMAKASIGRYRHDKKKKARSHNFNG